MEWKLYTKQFFKFSEIIIYEKKYDKTNWKWIDIEIPFENLG